MLCRMCHADWDAVNICLLFWMTRILCANLHGLRRSVGSWRVHCGGWLESESMWAKLKSAGIRPDICDVLERSAQVGNPSARVWRGSMVPTDRQGIKLLGTPFGHPDYGQTPPIHCARAQRPFGKDPDPTRQESAECLASLAALCISTGKKHVPFSGPQQDW